MKIISLVMVIVQTIFLSPLSTAHAADLTLKNTPAQVFFSPNDECTGAIVKEINKAKSDILVQAYSFTSEETAAALIEAHKRGIRVEIILDKSNRSAKNSAGDLTARMGIPTYVDTRHAIANNKVMIIDGETLITGSYNFTKAAEERNAENLLIIRNKDLAAIYRKNWEKHKEHAEKHWKR